MAEETTTQALFDLWKKQMEDGVQAWARTMAQGQAPDPSGFFRPLMEPAIPAWFTLLAQGPVNPEVLTQWKQFLDQCIAAWGKALEQAMGTETFARALATYLDRWLAQQTPFKQATGQPVETMLAALGLPSRTQVAGIARRQKDLEDSIEALGDRLESDLSLLSSKLGITQSAAARAPASPEGSPHAGTDVTG